MIEKVLNKTIKLWHGRTHYRYQQKIAGAIVNALINSRTGITTEVPIQIPRQAGKTTSVVDAVEFVLAGALRYFKRPISIGIFAPQTEQATTDFERLKSQLLEVSHLGFKTSVAQKGDLRIPQKWNSKTIKLYNAKGETLGEVYIFPINKNSNPESKTLDLIIVEECQDIIDEKMKKSVFPMGASTNAPRVYIGTAGTKLCYFKKQLDTNDNAVIIGVDEVFKQKQEAYEKTGDEKHLLYKTFVDYEIAQNGVESDYIQTQYMGKWIVGRGQFTDKPELDALMADRGRIEENKGENAYPCYVGIDTAKSPDSTVVTVLRDNHDLKKVQLCSWLEMHGENYEDQFDIIKNWLEQYENIRCVAIDATGQGSFMPDKFERHTGWNILPVRFSAPSKDEMYRNLQQVIKNKLTELPAYDETPEYKKFINQMITLEKEYKGRLMSCHHPKGTDDNGKPFHDDYTDSWALAELALSEQKQKEPNLRIL